MNAVLPTKRRIDAWDASLTEAQRWTVYYHMQRWTWAQAAEWAAKEYELASVPSRSAMYRFYDALMPQETDHRITSSIRTGEAAEALAKTYTGDEAAIATYKVMAQDLSLAGNEDRAMKYTAMAMKLAEQQTTTMELKLKAAAQQTRDKQLRLAREKFEAAEKRLQATADAIKTLDASGGLTPEARMIIEKAMGML